MLNLDVAEETAKSNQQWRREPDQLKQNGVLVDYKNNWMVSITADILLVAK